MEAAYDAVMHHQQPYCGTDKNQCRSGIGCGYQRRNTKKEPDRLPDLLRLPGAEDSVHLGEFACADPRVELLVEDIISGKKTVSLRQLQQCQMSRQSHF